MKHTRGKNTPIFLIGTGRSGTHWLGNSVASHPEIRATIEAQPMFSWATQLAFTPNPAKMQGLIWAYRWQVFLSIPKHYLDKNHPNIWHVEYLAKAFPNALFLGIERNPYATVSSMLLHDGVLYWQKHWKNYPVPNKFLGIDSGTANVYDDFPLAKQCAMRWLSHHNRMNTLKSLLGPSIKVIKYEHFANNPKKIIRELEQFLDLSHPLSIPDVKLESLHKWKKNLSDNQIQQIYEVIGNKPEYYE
jgi:hypothetical protein